MFIHLFLHKWCGLALDVMIICVFILQADTIITLWKNGFTINDGELRSYTDVANQRFLDSIKKGQVRFVFMGFAHYTL